MEATLPFPSETTAAAAAAASRPAVYRNLQEKAEEINLVLLQPTVDLWKLRELALSDGGLVNDTLRKRAWPKLIGLEKYETAERRCRTTNTSSSSTGATTTTTAVNHNNNNTQPAPPLSTTTSNDRTLVSTTIDEDDHAKFEIDTALLPPAHDNHSNNNNNNNHDLSSASASASGAAGSAAAAHGRRQQQQQQQQQAHHQPTSTTTTSNSYPDLLVQCMDVEQIERDVARCTWHLLTGSQRSRRNQIQRKDKSKKVLALLKKKQRRLANLINLTLVESYYYFYHHDANEDENEDEDEKLRYYQGYHDVACIFMHALGGGPTALSSAPSSSSIHSSSLLRSLPTHIRKDPLGLELAARVLCHVSFSHFRDSMRSNFVSLQNALKIALYPLLAQLDMPVHNHLQDVDMEPFFCLSWVLTWFSHDVRDTNLCKRLFDAFLSGHPLLVLYVSLAMMLHPFNRTLILETDCDFAALHQCLASLPKHSCRVGWKRASWERGGGYISDDDDDDMTTTTTTTQRRHDMNADDDTTSYFNEEDGMDDDDQTASTDMDTSSILPTPSVQTAPSLYSATSHSTTMGGYHQLGPTTIEEGAEQRVPFQDLIDTALQYMARYPPRCLEDLARRYYERQQQEQQAQHTTAAASSSSSMSVFATPPSSTRGISLLQDPPTWSLIPMAPADWVLKQRLRQELGLKGTSRKDRRKKAATARSSSVSATTEEEMAALSSDFVMDSSFSKPDYDYLKRHANDRAVIAAGYGPGPEAILERKRQRRRLATAVAVGFLAMTVSLAFQRYYDYNPSPTTLLESSSTTVSQMELKNINKAKFVKSLLHPKSSSTEINHVSKVAGAGSSAAAILSTSTATTSMNDAVLTVADYCKRPIAYMLNNQSTDDDAERQQEVLTKNKNNQKSKTGSATATPATTTTTTTTTTATSFAVSPAKATIQRPDDNKVPVDTTTQSTGRTLKKETSSPSSSKKNSKLTATMLSNSHASYSMLGDMVERYTLKILRFLLQPIRWILGKGGGENGKKKRVVLGNLWAWLDQQGS